MDPAVIGASLEHAAPPPRPARRRRRPSGAPPPLLHHLRTSGVGWLVALVVCVVFSISVFGSGVNGVAVPITVADDAVVRLFAGWHIPGSVAMARGLVYAASWWTILAATYALILVLVVFRRWQHLVVFVVAIELAGLVAALVQEIIPRPRPFGVAFRAGWGGWAMPSLHVGGLAMVLVAVLYALVPEGRARNAGKWGAGALVAAIALARLYLGIEAPTDLLVGAVIGTAIPLLAFRLFTPSDLFPVNYRRGRSAHLDVGGARGQAIRQALEDQLGLVVAEIRPFGLAGSAGSTPLRITCAGRADSYLFGKLYARSHMRSDRSYKFGRELLYGRLEDEKPFNTVRRLVQQEDYALRLMRDAGLPSAEPFGFVELTPEREYLLVTEFFDGASELGEADIDDAVIDDGLGIIRKLWDAGLAHRDVKPANLLVRKGRMLLIDVAFAEVRPSPWRQAVDLANMMLCLGLRGTAERVYQRALLQFTVDEISEAFAAARGLALPSQLRRALRGEGRDLHAEFLELLPKRPRPIRVQRWSPRRVGLWMVTLFVVFLLGMNLITLYDTELSAHTSVPIGNLGCLDAEPLWLEAQSVMSASQVPCVASLPPGWHFAHLYVNGRGSELALDHDRAGPGALRVSYKASCDTTSATEVAIANPGIRRLLSPAGGTSGLGAGWYDVFPGGCATVRLHSISDRPEVNAALRGEVSRALGFTRRSVLRQLLLDRSDGRLHLDPTEKR